MAFINWKRAKANNLQEAFWLVKEHGKAKKNLSVARMAELMGLDDDSILYKWIKHASMPTNKVVSFQYVCGANYITEYLAAQEGKLLIDIPTGKQIKEVEVMEMQGSFNEAVSLLIKLADGKSTVDEAVAALTTSMQNIAYHRENVKKNQMPELDFEAEQ